MVELRHLNYFIAVAEERHFGRAAGRLKMAQPPLSRQIQALEKELGVPLFDRSRRKVELTVAGSTLLHHARQLFDAVERATRETQRAARGERGRIAIGYASAFAYSGLPELLRQFRSDYPDVEVALSELTQQAQIDALKQGRLDVGFVRAPLDEDALASLLVRREPLVVALPIDHPAGALRRIALEQLKGEPFVCFPRSRGPAFFDHLMRLCHQAGFTPRIVQEGQQLDILSLVSAGFGVAIVSSSMRHGSRGGVVFRPIVGSPKTDLRVAWKEENPSPIVRGLVEMVRTQGLRSASHALPKVAQGLRSASHALPKVAQGLRSTSAAGR